ncbi:MAG: isoprenylcysteine carboxylmethyltransferase family protein [Kiritimatiellae bacterium]|nr:isoprenylcysteine carboxylmethyltransferase family protein [Kiritimatiellia bacterium]
MRKLRIVAGRIASLLVFAYVLCFAPPKFIPGWAAESASLLGLLLLGVAALGRVWCLVFIAGKKKDLLQTDGPFSLVRNPLYVFSFIGFIGFGLAVKNPPLAVILGILFSVYYPFIVRREEKRLTNIFGDVYRDYQSKTPRWIPDFRLYREPETMNVYPAKIREGILDAMWFIWAFFGWEALEVMRELGILPVIF